MNYKFYIKYVKELLHLAMPIIMGHIGFVLIMAGDVFVAAKYSTEVLAAVGISSSITSIIFMFGLGLITSTSAILSNKLGAKESAKAYLIPTLKFAMVMACIITFLILLIIPIFELIGYEAHVLELIKKYTIIFAFSSFGGYLYAALKEFLQSYEIVFFPNIISILGIFLNLVLNWAFAFGVGFIPEMGIVGLGLASLLVRIIMGLTLLIFCLIKFKIKVPNKSTLPYYENLIKVGLPISFAVCSEFLAFNSMIIIMGRVSPDYAAAQNIINVIASTSFMIPLSISTAITIKVGFSNGAKNLVDIKNYSLVGCLMSVCFMMFCGIIFANFPKQITTLFTADTNLINIIVPIMFIVACFQVFDGLQVSLGGIYKGLKRTNIVFLSNLLGYVILGIPLGTFLALKLNLNLFGFWIGIGVASATLCVILGTNLVILLKKIKNDFCSNNLQDDLYLIK